MACSAPLVLGYTIWDDGVHAVCENGNHERPWDRNLGFGATPQDAMAAQQAHDAGQEA